MTAIQKIESEAVKLSNSGLCSYATTLESMYEVASENKNYERAHLIQILIAEEINS